MHEKIRYGTVPLLNPHIKGQHEDILYHLGLSKTSHNLPKMFGDIKFVCVGGTKSRAEEFAKIMIDELKHVLGDLPANDHLTDISQKGERYSMYKAGPVLSISHGIGMPSISILLNELIKLMNYASVKNPQFFRLGTCGGLGIEPGTCVLSEIVVDSMLEPTYNVPILGEIVKRPARFQEKFLRHIKQFAEENYLGEVITGKTMCTSDFYEGQGRLDGAFCEFTEKEKMHYLNTLKSKGVINIEMESLAFAALTFHAGIASAVLCVSIVDRLKGDQITVSKETLKKWELRPLKLVAKYIKKSLE